MPKLTPLAKRGLWHAGMRRARLQAVRGAGSLAMQARPAGAHGHQMLRREAERRVRGPVMQGAVTGCGSTARADAARRVLVAGMFPGDAAGAAGRDLILRDGAQTPAQSVGGGALATPRPSN